MEYRKGEELELTLHGFSPDGRAVGRTAEGLTVFVQGGLAGQRVQVRLAAVKKRLAEAEVLTVHEAAPEERTAPCPHASACGGCPWQSLPLPLQLTWKQRLVRDALTRIGHMDLPEGMVRPVLSTGQEWGYRNKMEFAFGTNQAGKMLLGLRSRASHDVTEVTGCLLQTTRTMVVLQALRDLCSHAGLTAAPQGMYSQGRRRQQGAFSSAVHQTDILRFAVIREPRHGGCLVELITLPSPQEARNIRKLGQALLDGPWGVTGFVHSTRTDPSPVACGERTEFILGEGGLSETLFLQGRDVTFRLDHNSFFQVNSNAAERLYETAAEEASRLFPGHQTLWGKSCWDIYCGVGGLALTMAPHFQEILGMEIVAPAVALASANASALNQEDTSFRFETGDASTLERCFKRFGSPDLLVTDPPRSGMDPRTVQAILRHRPPRLLLVSCNPATLARDLALLTAAYEIRSVQPVDLFPQTPHIETVVALSLRQKS